jgi:hypothetical protein
MLTHLKITWQFHAHPVHQKVSRFFGPRYIGDDLFLGPNLVSFSLAVVPYEISKVNYTPFLWYHGFYDTAVFILSVPMHCSATRRFFYLYIHKHNSHIYRNVWSFCPNVLNFCKYTYFYLFLRNSGHFYFTLIPCFVKCPIIKP